MDPLETAREEERYQVDPIRMPDDRRTAAAARRRTSSVRSIIDVFHDVVKVTLVDLAEEAGLENTLEAIGDVIQDVNDVMQDAGDVIEDAVEGASR